MKTEDLASVETRVLKWTYFGEVNVPVLFDIDIKMRAAGFIGMIGQ